MFLFPNVAMATAMRPLSYQKIEVCVVNLYAGIFGNQRIGEF